MTTSTEVNFKQALKDLQEVNDQLFYGELKGKMEQHLHQLETEYAKVEHTMEGVQFKLERFEDEFNRITQEATGQMRTTVSNLQQDVPAFFDEQLNILGEAFVPFLELVDEQKKWIDEHKQTMLELQQTLAERQKEHYETMESALQGHIAKQQEILKEHFEMNTRWLEQQINQFKILLTTLTDDVFKNNQEVKSGFSYFEAIMNDSANASQLQHEMAQQYLEALRAQQKEAFALVQQNQTEQKHSTKKWMTAIVVIQVILTGAVAGLYFL